MRKHREWVFPLGIIRKQKNILMGTPASESIKRVQKNLSSF